MKKEGISGTGNGIDKKYMPDLIESLEEYSKLLNRIVKNWKIKMEKEGSVFSGKYHAITNWYTPYKIDIPISEMPTRLIDTYQVNAGFYYSDSVRVGIHLPTKVACKHINGGEGTGGTVLFSEKYIHDIKEFSEDERFSEEFRKLVMQELLEKYEARAEEKYKDRIKNLKTGIKNNSARIEELSQGSNNYVEEIDEIERKLVELYDLQKNKD